MAMAFALIGLRVDGIEIDDPSCVAKTFPRFWEALDRLRLPRVPDGTG
jgi:3-phosphoshikimate 1-carboxyvinyltransferase